MKTTTVPTSIALAAIACASFGSALAGSASGTVTTPSCEPTPSATSPWQFRLEPYLWLPGLNGSVGARGQWNFSNKWFLAGKADLGGFGVSSDFLWSAQATLGYQFTDRFSTEIGYRHNDTDYKNGGFTYDLAMSGLFAGFDFKF